ncbi:CLUMA_CG004664, isoform A [Clunio marinus]|uniref:CLUMA_CG004664, isoform A n=2 Tax=Clunio marinus TaxID=568069 RepID=A0A1J1HSE2_9DIPT|nr:CLUMA_CG004664, isoform A [Clunio marinus]
MQQTLRNTSFTEIKLNFGGDYSGIYSHTPGPPVGSSHGFSGSSMYLPPSASGSDPEVGPPQSSQSYSTSDPEVGPSQGVQSYSGSPYLPPSGMAEQSPQAAAGFSYPNRRRRVRGRQLSEESVTLFGDLFFRFLGVNTDQCKKRFVCELEFRNPFLGYAMRYVGVELFKEYVTSKEGPQAPKKFTDCAKLYTECRAPNETSTGIIRKRRKQIRRQKNSTTTESNSVEETTTEVNDEDFKTNLFLKYFEVDKT